MPRGDTGSTRLTGQWAGSPRLLLGVARESLVCSALSILQPNKLKPSKWESISVMYVTDSIGKGKYSYYTGMKILFKVVTVLLLVFMGTGPLLAAIPCQEQGKASMCCKADCPMMAAQVKSSNQPRTNSGDSTTQCGCQVSPNTPAFVSIPPAQWESREMALADNMLAGLLPIVAFRAEDDNTPPDRQSRRHSRSVLCTFQI